MEEVLEQFFTGLRNSWRFRWRALGVAWLVAMGGWLFVYTIPNQYRVDAKVHVDTASILRPLLHGLAVQPDLNQAVELLTRTLLSRANLERIARKSNLDLGGLSLAQKDRLLNSLAHAIKISNPGKDVYDIAYSNASPAVAKSVVQEVLDIMMTDALGSTAQSSTSAQKFLQSQVTDYASKLSAAEQALAKFKRKNIGYLPSEKGNYFSQLQAAQQKREDLQNALSVAQAQFAALKNQTAPMIQPASDPIISALNKRILNDEQALSDLLTQYTSEYPGVIAMKDRIRLEKQQRAELVKQFVQNQGRGAELNSMAYQSLLQQQGEAAVTIQTLKQQLRQTTTLIARLKSRADKITEVEVQLEALTRSYDVTKGQYNQLLSRLYSAELSQTVQASGNPLKFQVIDPPVQPVLPSWPERHLLSLVVLFAALAAGAAFAYLSAMLKPVFMTRAELTETLALPVIGAISFATTQTYQQVRRLGVTGFLLSLTVLLIVGFVAVIYANDASELVRMKLMGGSL